MSRDYFAGCIDGPAPELDAGNGPATRPPAGAPTLFEVVEAIAGEPLSPFGLKWFGELVAVSATRDERREARNCYAHFRGAGVFGHAEPIAEARRLTAQIALYRVIERNMSRLASAGRP